MKEIAYIALTPLGDVICCMNQLEHLKKLYMLPMRKPDMQLSMPPAQIMNPA